MANTPTPKLATAPTLEELERRYIELTTDPEALNAMRRPHMSDADWALIVASIKQNLPFIAASIATKKKALIQQAVPTATIDPQ